MKKKSARTEKKSTGTLASRLRGRIELSEQKMEKLFAGYVNLLSSVIMNEIERHANPDQRSFRGHVCDFGYSSGRIQVFTSFSGSLWGPAIALLANRKMNDHVPFTDHLRNQAKAFEEYVNHHESQLFTDLKAKIEAEGFEVALASRPIKNWRYDNGVQGYELAFSVQW